MAGKKILVVDDEEDIRMVVERRLVTAGYAVVTAGNGRDGLLAAKKERPDLILLDINMPDMDGGEVGQQLKSDPGTAGIPIIYLTALADRTIREAGGQHFLSKPYNPKELLEAISKYI
jgi:CheY-like chemotaxis protein